MSKEYDAYLKAHCAAVVAGFKWMTKEIGKPELRDILPEVHLDTVAKNINYHDASKRDPREYEPYDDYFYGPNGVKSESGEASDEVREAFNKAFLYHIHSNPHHWQYWILKHDDPEFGIIDEEPIEMEDNYILEMICDWWSFSWRKGDLYELFNWWNDHESRIKLGYFAREKVEKLLRAICNKLNTEQYVVDSSKLSYIKVEVGDEC